MMNGIDVILAELDDMSEEEREEAMDAITAWAEDNNVNYSPY